MRVSLLQVCGALLFASTVLSSARASAQRNTHILPLQLGAPVVGEPLSATRTLDYEPAENSTDPVAVHAEEKYYRDSAGQTRSEIKYPGQLPIIYIIDPIAHMEYRWIPGDMVVSSFKLKETATPTETTPPQKLPDDAPQIEGILTRHSHWATGKDKVEESNDTWYAPDLHLALLTIVDKLGIGKTTYRFVHISRDEPDAELFNIPAGLKIQDDMPPPPVIPTADAVNGPAPANSDWGPIERLGGGVSPPVVIHTENPEYTEQARKQRLTGTVLVNMVVDQYGMPRNVHVLRGVGMGLDENAVESVRKYRFKPAMKDGNPVAVELNVQVMFQISNDKK